MNGKYREHDGLMTDEQNINEGQDIIEARNSMKVIF